MRARLATTITLLLCGTAVAEDREPAAMKPTGEVFFAFDSAELTAAASEKLAKIADGLEANPSGKVVVGGHADPRGTEAYNVGLSARRAEAVRDALVREGVDADRIVLGVYGENAPRRERFALDRRVGIELTREPLHAIIDRAMPDATAVMWAEPATVAEIEGRPIPVATR